MGFLQHATRLGARRLRQLAEGLGFGGFGGLPLGSALDGYSSWTLSSRSTATNGYGSMPIS